MARSEKGGFRVGAAVENDVPVIPLVRWGTDHIFNGYTKKLRPFPRRPVTHSVGDPLDLSAHRGMKSHSASLLREVTDLMMTEVVTLLADIRREQPPSKESEITEQANIQQTDGD